MSNLTVRIIFDRRGLTRTNTEKEAHVHIEVREFGASRRKMINTGVKLRRDQFSFVDGKGVEVRKHPNASILRHRIMRMYNDIERFTLSGACKTLDDVDNWNKTDEELNLGGQASFISFFKAQMETHTPTIWVAKNWNALLVRLEEFGAIQTFDDLTHSNIEALDYFLRRTISKQPVMHKRHSLLKRVIDMAENRGLIEPKKNPYNTFRFAMGKSAEPVSLEEREVKLIENYEPKTPAMNNIKNMYLFQIYTGLAYVDMQNFSKQDIVEVGEHLMIKSARQKTEVNYVTLFTEGAEIIAREYDYQLPTYTNAHYNRQLKQLALEIGISKHLTSHTARHTFATTCINRGVDIVVLSKALGHTNLKQTQRYARLNPTTIAREMADKMGGTTTFVTTVNSVTKKADSNGL